MTTRSVSTAATMAPTKDAATGDAETMLNDWLEAQGNLLGETFGQIVSAQQALLASWFDLMDREAASRTLDAWWSPWAFVWQRGGEQLA